MKVLAFPKPIVPRVSNFTQKDRAACWKFAAQKFAFECSSEIQKGRYANAEALAQQAIRCMHRAVNAEGEQP